MEFSVCCFYGNLFLIIVSVSVAWAHFKQKPQYLWIEKWTWHELWGYCIHSCATGV